MRTEFKTSLLILPLLCLFLMPGCGNDSSDRTAMNFSDPGSEALFYAAIKDTTPVYELSLIHI